MRSGINLLLVSVSEKKKKTTEKSPAQQGKVLCTAVSSGLSAISSVRLFTSKYKTLQLVQCSFNKSHCISLEFSFDAFFFLNDSFKTKVDNAATDFVLYLWYLVKGQKNTGRE